MLRMIAVLVALFLFAACSRVVLQPDMERVKDQSLAFQEGYKAGCHSGFVAGGSLVHSFSRDSQRILDDEQYNLGWKDGYRQCKSDFRELCKSEALVSKADLYCSDVWQQELDKE
jgi:hypothetical protein